MKGARAPILEVYLLYSLIVWWHEQVRARPAPSLRRWRGKSHPSFADMLVALRLETLGNLGKTLLSTPPLPPDVQKFLDHLARPFELAT